MEQKVTNNRNAGFSLIELLIVVAILAVATAIAVPSVQQWVSKSRIKSEARKLVVEMRKAKSEAIKRGQVVGIRFTAGTGAAGSYLVFIDTDGDLLFDVGEQSITQGNMPAGVRLYDPKFGDPPVASGISVGYQRTGFSQDNWTGSVRLSYGENLPAYEISQSLTGKVSLAVLGAL